VEKSALADQVTDLATKLEEQKKKERATQSKVNVLESEFSKKMEAVAAEAEEAKTKVRDLSKERDTVQQALTRVNVQLKEAIKQKEAAVQPIVVVDSAKEQALNTRVQQLEQKLARKDKLLTTQANLLSNAGAKETTPTSSLG